MSTANDNLISSFPIGSTIEAGCLRMHRYGSCIRILDVQNAGKRGKTVRELYVSNLDMGTRAEVDALADALVRAVAVELNFSQCYGIAEHVAAENKKFKVTTSTLKAVGIQPAGFLGLDIVGANIRVLAYFDHFHVCDLNDKQNEETLINSEKRSQKNAKAFYAWAKANASAIETMTFNECSRALKAAGVTCHRYCAMD